MENNSSFYRANDTSLRHKVIEVGADWVALPMDNQMVFRWVICPYAPIIYTTDGLSDPDPEEGMGRLLNKWQEQDFNKLEGPKVRIRALDPTQTVKVFVDQRLRPTRQPR